MNKISGQVTLFEMDINAYHTEVGRNVFFLYKMSSLLVRISLYYFNKFLKYEIRDMYESKIFLNFYMFSILWEHT